MTTTPKSTPTATPTAPTITWSPAALQLFDLTGPTAVSAGAGSGKTTALVELCTRLLSGEATGAPIEPGAIVAITFTEKAAEELAERLRAAVAGRAARAAAEEAPDAADWAERLRSLDRMAVGTIHGWCGRLLREHALEAGLDPEFSVLDEEQAGTILAEAARAAVVAALDAGQPGVREWAAGLGAAGARGGLADLVAGLVRERATRGDRAPPEPALAEPGTAEALRGRLLAAARGALSARADARTAGARELVEGLGRAMEAVTPADQEGQPGPAALPRLTALAAAVKGKRTGKGEEHLRAFRDDLVEAAAALEAAAAEALGAPQRRALAALVADAEARATAARRAAGALDFDDLLLEARDLLARDAALRTELRARLSALLVDEYQDVNGVQQALFELLAGPGAPGGEAEPPGPRLVAVGDLKQSIYRFRGADVGVFAGVIGRLGTGERGGRVLHLADNHRSAPAVLDLVNEVSAVALRPPAGLAPRPFELSFDPADRLVARRPGGAAPAAELLVDGEKGNAAARREREAAALAARIRALVSGEAGVAVMERAEGGERPRRPRFGDVAILFRRLTALGAYEQALRAAGVQMRVARGGGFYQAPEVRDLAELLASLADPEDALAWAALLRSPLCAVGDGALLLLARDGLPRLARLPSGELPAGLEEAERARLIRFLDAWRVLHAVADRVAPHELLRRAVEALDLDAALVAAPEGERRWRNVEKAVELARRLGERGATAGEVAGRWRALAARPPREPEADLEGGDAVSILSIHQAKGLEWPVVFLPDLGARARADADRARLDPAGRLCAAWYDPAAEAFRTTTSLEAARAEDRRAASAESRRLLYVALTRARDRLVLSGEGPSSGDSWRGFIEGAAAAQPGLVQRIGIEEAERAVATAATASATPTASAAPTPTPTPTATPTATATATAISPPTLAPPAPLPAIRLAVTDLVEYARCPRRHHLARRLGLPEPKGDRGGALDDDPARATARGTLAHAMLAEADLAAPPLERRAQLTAAAARRGYDPGSPGVRPILREVARFLESPGGRALAAAAAAGRLRREVPFLLRLDGAPGQPACYLDGAIDALVLPARRGQPLLVADYKYAMARPGSPERYRLQLLAYALAAARAHGGARVEARLQFLRGDFRVVDVTPPPEALADFAREAPALAAGVARGDGDRPPEALGRDVTRCRAEGCGFVSRCFRPEGEGGSHRRSVRGA